MFVLAKTFNFLTHPGLWVGLLLLAGTVMLWTGWRRFGRWVLTVTMGFVAVVTIVPVGLFMVEPLENRFPAVTDLAGPVDGIVVLGGSVNQLATRYRGQPSLTGGAERLTEFIALARRHPHARLAFSGGSGLVGHQDVKEAETARLFFDQMGLDTKRVVFEDQSRNTFENALYTFKLLTPKPGERWVLITSASHMPRAVGSFRKAGWAPIPFPVDYTTYGPGQRTIGFNMVQRLGRFGTGLRAWSALLIYRVLGRTDALFPAPEAPDDAGQ